MEDHLLVLLEVEGVDRLVQGAGVDDIGLEDVWEGGRDSLRVASDLVGQLSDFPGPDPHQAIIATTDDIILIDKDRRDRAIMGVGHLP